MYLLCVNFELSPLRWEEAIKRAMMGIQGKGVGGREEWCVGKGE